MVQAIIEDYSNSDLHAVTAYFDRADITINGKNPWDIKVLDNRFYKRFRKYFTIGLLESYAEKWINVEDFEELFYRLLRNRVYFDFTPSIALITRYITHKLLPLNRIRSGFVAEKHYDLPQELFMSFLGDSKAYTSAYFMDRATGKELDFQNHDNLDKAQFAKLDLSLDKLELIEGDTLLDIGCGWGSLVKHAAKRGIKSVGITVSVAQAEYAKKWCEGLPVEILLQSYTEPLVNPFNSTGLFDAVSSLGMIEHVGTHNLGAFFKRSRELCKPDGNLLVQSISSPYPMSYSDPYTDKHIFPDSNCPTSSQVTGAAEKNNWKKQDEHLFVDSKGVSYYHHTCMDWDYNLKQNWSETRKHITHMDKDEFFRLWGPCFQIFAGMFRAGTYPQLRQYLFNGLDNSQLPIIR
jgi:cyclopropane-fatty-acyl-phospholipid synthase